MSNVLPKRLIKKRPFKMKLKNKPQITAWLVQGELGQVLEELMRQLKESRRSGKDLLKTATSLSAQLEKVRADKLKGIITYEEETIANNKLLDRIQEFITVIESPAPVKEPVEPEDNKQPVTPISTEEKSNVWKWAALVLAMGLGIWWLFFREPSPTTVDLDIRICTLPTSNGLDHCTSDMPRLTPAEAAQGVVVSALFLGGSPKDPYIEGVLLTDIDETVCPTEKIVLTMRENGVGYACQLVPTYGFKWWPGKYIIRLQCNKVPAGERKFEVIGEPADENYILPNLDSVMADTNNSATSKYQELLKFKDE
jgi:Effector-associated domain 11